MGENWTLAVTGASGALMAGAMLRMLVADARLGRVDFVATESALRVLAEELGITGRQALVERLLDGSSDGLKDKVRQHVDADIGASIASGSYESRGMIVLPCSMGTLSGIAHGAAQGLVERAADVCLKERRKLVLCVRETPLNLIHLRNMVAATEAGATVYPVMAAFYDGAATADAMATQFCRRVLGHCGLKQEGVFEWGA